MRTRLVALTALIALHAWGCGDNGNQIIDAAPPVDAVDAGHLPQCMDGIDNDGDGKTDYPNDPGCVVPNQEDETDDCPSGPSCPQCSDGIDNDHNGKIDYPMDPGCTSAADDDEFVHDPLACGASATIKQLPVNGIDSGTLAAASIGSLPNACGGSATTTVPMMVYELHLDVAKVVIASTNGSPTDTVVDIRKPPCSAADASLACEDNIDVNNKASIVQVSLEAGDYYLVVAGRTSGSLGTYVLHVNFYSGAGTSCTDSSMCGPGLVCRVKLGDTMKTCQPHVCSDGVDDDADGKNDYPDDPGCASPLDDDETDDCPSGPTCPQCSNGLDDDGDGHIDYPMDTSCHAASDTSESCQTSEGITVITSGTTTGDTTGQTNDYHPSCGSSTNTAPDLLYRLDVPHMATLDLNLTAAGFWDTATVLLPSSCIAPEVACADSTDMPLVDIAAGTYFFVVDGWSSGFGAFSINLSGTVAPGGSCEDPLFAAGVFTCAPGLTCQGTPGARTCISQCSDGLDNNGDGRIDYPFDPGCSSPFDDSETTVCPGAMCPACADGLDNDGDGLVDYPADPNCTAAGATSESCISSEAVTPLELAVNNVDTTGSTDDYNPICAAGFGSAGDLTYSIALPTMTSLSITLEPGFLDLVGELLGPSCGGTALACVEADFGASTLTTGSLAAGTYFYVVDGWFSDTGPATVTITGSIAPGASCESPLAQAGALQCGLGSICGGAVGSRICQPAQCSDGIDNNGDGKIDYPADPGCASPSDNTETTVCPGVMCPACSNGVDDDADTLTDYPADFGCAAAGGTTETFCPPDVDQGPSITMPTTSGNLATAAHNLSFSCQSSTDHDFTYPLQLPVPVAALQIDTLNSTTVDTVLSLRDVQCGTELGCDDDISTGTWSIINFTNLAAGNYAVNVAGYNTTNNGPYVVNIHGTVAAGTACTSPLFAAGVLSCPTGTSCTGGTCH